MTRLLALPFALLVAGAVNAAPADSPQTRLTACAFNLNVWKTAQKAAIVTATASALVPTPTKTPTAKPTATP